MRGLFTADWQAERSNLDLCDQAWKQVIEIVQEKELEFVCICGDLKRQYSPVDVKVILWWQRAIAKLRKLDKRVIIVNGNHDRIGMYDDQQNWLPVLRRAGAEVFDEPEVVNVQDGQLAILPFCSSIPKLKQWADELSHGKRLKRDSSASRILSSRQEDSTSLPRGENLRCSTNHESSESQRRRVLVFHADLKNASYNKLGAKSEATIKPEDLHPDRYRACIGGHIHLAQKLGKNVYYTGSPFCMDWGEANQKKSYLVIRGTHIVSVPSEISGWYDEMWPGFPQTRRDWSEARVRIHIRVPSSCDYTKLCTEARVAAERKYPGGIVSVVAEFEDKQEANVRVKLDDPDRVKIKEYVRQTEYQQEKQMVEYLMSKLERTGGTQRAGSTVKFHSTRASNFLSWKKLEMKFEPGITVIEGPNGAGKTSLMQPLPVALFGTTFKGQKYDRWARRGTEESAEVQVSFRDARQRKVRVTRGRRPNRIVLSIDGVDCSSGQRGDQKDATQGLIEQVCGFSWQTFANAVFIDPEISRAFLNGTKKQRTEVLNRFQNLERFEKAQQLVRHDRRENEKQRFETELELEQARRIVVELSAECEQLAKQHKRDERELKTAMKAAQDELDESGKVLKTNTLVRSKKMTKLESQTGSLNQRVGALDKSIGELQFEKREISQWLANTGALHEDKECPTCYQPLNLKLLHKMQKAWSNRLQEVSQQGGEYQSDRAKLMRELALLEAQMNALSVEASREEEAVKVAKVQVDFALQRLRAFHNAEISEENQLTRKQQQLKQASVRVEVQTKYIVQLQDNEKFYEYAEQALGRDGIPAFLNRQLAPVLNKAAEYYSELFVDKEIQVRFEVEDGEFEAKIINANGGEDFEAQSAGERALAGLVASFALREAAPRSNVLILDEPGEGLDGKNARRFAAALPLLAARFGCVYVTTHNQNIVGELSGERTLTIAKKNGTSYIQ